MSSLSCMQSVANQVSHAVLSNSANRRFKSEFSVRSCIISTSAGSGGSCWTDPSPLSPSSSSSCPLLIFCSFITLLSPPSRGGGGTSLECGRGCVLSSTAPRVHSKLDTLTFGTGCWIRRQRCKPSTRCDLCSSSARLQGCGRSKSNSSQRAPTSNWLKP